ncbi:MAG: 5'-methylthioadenosine/adenosylhomocysteine nucleosidase, partial [Oscillospiraceae bacterium]|nr:5'-methylthioadenosine/adenosylhomocysteine nucleosidase [Oscillospiraceae bacterium]
MKIAIIGAMEIEVKTIKQLIEKPNTKMLYDMPITEGIFEDKQIVVAQCFPGKVNAAICTQTIIINHKPDQIINIGVAGGCHHMNIGDVAVAKEFIQHDIDTTPLGEPMGLIPGLCLTSIPSDDGICENLIKAAKKANLVFHKSIFATGDQFATPQKIEYIKKYFDSEIFEMEGAAIAHVCKRAKIPFGAARVVSDNGHAKTQYE